MITCYVASTGIAGGKTTMCAGLGKRLLDDGKKIAYFKSLRPDGAGTGNNSSDKDAGFIRATLKLDEPKESPYLLNLSQSDIEAALASGDKALRQKLSAAYSAGAKVSPDKDVVLVEGVGEVVPGTPAGEAARHLVALLQARALLVIPYSPRLSVEQVSAASQIFSNRLIGVIINKVPSTRLNSIKDSLVPALEKAGLKVLGVIPEDRTLFGTSVDELVRHLEGKVLNNPERSGEVVENVMVGAMSVDSGLLYYSRKSNKAVITRADRADIQMAALETPTHCIVLTGTTLPLDSILYRAKEKTVPLIQVADNTPATLARLETVFATSRFHQEKKLERLEELLSQNFDFKTFYRNLGL